MNQVTAKMNGVHTNNAGEYCTVSLLIYILHIENESRQCGWNLATPSERGIESEKPLPFIKKKKLNKII